MKKVSLPQSLVFFLVGNHLPPSKSSTQLISNINYVALIVIMC